MATGAYFISHCRPNGSLAVKYCSYQKGSLNEETFCPKSTSHHVGLRRIRLRDLIMTPATTTTVCNLGVSTILLYRQRGYNAFASIETYERCAHSDSSNDRFKLYLQEIGPDSRNALSRTAVGSQAVALHSSISRQGRRQVMITKLDGLERFSAFDLN